MSTPPSEEPLVSAVIPAYNAASFLPECVESVLNQTYPNVEPIVVDDGSTDETPEVMSQYEDRVCYIRKENGGSASARNRGIEAANGDFIALLDADDRWRPEKVSQQVALHQRRPELMWSYTNWVQVDADTGETIYRADQIRETEEGEILRPLIGSLFVPPSTEIFRKEVFETVGTYDESELHRISEDWEFSLRVAERYPIGYIDRPLVERRKHASKKTSTMDLEHALRSRRAIIEKTIDRNPERLEDRRGVALARLHTIMGRKRLNREERREAIRMFATALSHHSTYLPAWVYGICAFLPRPVLRVLGRLRAAFWRVTRDQNAH